MRFGHRRRQSFQVGGRANVKPVSTYPLSKTGLVFRETRPFRASGQGYRALVSFRPVNDLLFSMSVISSCINAHTNWPLLPSTRLLVDCGASSDPANGDPGAGQRRARAKRPPSARSSPERANATGAARRAVGASATWDNDL